jgi:hypothetical protein
VTYPRRKLYLRKLTPEDVAAIVEDYTARMNAMEARRRGLETLRTTPTLRQHAERTGVSYACLKQMVAGWTYKEILSQIGHRRMQ